MSVSTLNNSIISYCEFFDKRCNHPANNEIQKSLVAVKQYYQKFKENEDVISEIKHYLESLNSESAYDISISYTEPEVLWAYIHLMIESIEERKINLWKKEPSFSDVKVLQNGMGRLWTNGHKTVYMIML